MRKFVKAGLCGVAAAMLFTAGCSNKAAETESGAAGTVTESAGETTAEETIAPEEEFGEEYVAETSLTLGEYKGIPVTVQEVEVTDEMVEQQIQMFLNSASTYESVDRAAKLGDTVNIDYKGLKDGVAFDGGTAEAQDLTLGSGQFIDGFEDGLVGAKKGESRSLDLTFPEEYHSEELAGAEVVFEVTVNEVKELVTPKLDDAFVKEFFPDYATVEEFRTALYDVLVEQAENMVNAQKENDLLQAIISDSEIECATEVINDSYRVQLNSYIVQAAGMGMDLANLASMYGMTEEDLKSQIREASKEMAKQEVVLKEIAELENITIDEADMEELAKSYNYESVEKMLTNVNITEDMIEDTTLMRKAMDFVIENAVVTVE